MSAVPLVPGASDRRRLKGMGLLLGASVFCMPIAFVAATASREAPSDCSSDPLGDTSCPPPALQAHGRAVTNAAKPAILLSRARQAAEMVMMVSIDQRQDVLVDCSIGQHGDTMCPPVSSEMPARLRLQSAQPVERPWPPGVNRTDATSIVLILDIDSRGYLTNVSVERSSRDRALDRTAMEHARRLVFEPATFEGQEVMSRLRATVSFEPLKPKSRSKRVGRR